MGMQLCTWRESTRCSALSNLETASLFTVAPGHGDSVNDCWLSAELGAPFDFLESAFILLMCSGFFSPVFLIQ